jgi:hypothetical protein
MKDDFIYDNMEDEINNRDILNKLYHIFDDIDETVYNEFLSYKNIQDDNNIFIMIDRESLHKILEKIPKLKKTRIKNIDKLI